MIERIFNAIRRDGIFGTTNSLWGRFHCRFENYTNLLNSDNHSVKLLHRQTKVYNRLFKKYKSIIDNDIPTEISPEHCNKVWICWFQGEENAPELIKCCINSARKVMPDREIVVITMDNLSQYATLPDYTIEKYKKGIIPAAQFSDLIRIELLCRHGGIWIDSTVLCTDSADQREVILNSDLFMYKVFDLENSGDKPILASNWLICAKANHPILMLTRKLLYKYWETSNYLDHYFIFHFFLAMAARKYSDLWDRIPSYNNSSPHTMIFELLSEYNEERWHQLEKISDFHKLNRHNDFNTNRTTVYKHIIDTYKQ